MEVKEIMKAVRRMRDYLRYDLNMVPSDKPIRYDYYEAYSVMGTG